MFPKDGDLRQRRRLMRYYLREDGWHRRDVADAPHVTERSVSRWMAVARVRGAEGLLSATIPRRPPALSLAERRMIPEYASGAPVLCRDAGAASTRASLYYDGEFYEGVFVRPQPPGWRRARRR
jgi:hypothetical protein